jgi:hypothetical protein
MNEENLQIKKEKNKTKIETITSSKEQTDIHIIEMLYVIFCYLKSLESLNIQQILCCKISLTLKSHIAYLNFFFDILTRYVK